MTTRIVCAALLLLAAAVTAEARAPVPKGRAKAEPDVHVVGVYETARGGRRPLGRRTAPVVTVRVGDVKTPVVLVLTAYERVTWRIDAPPGAVARVIASGYNAQTVEGVSDKVPVTRLSYEGGDKDYFYAWQREAGANAEESERQGTKRQYDKLAARVKELTGREIKTFQGEYAGTLFEVK